ncbi:hypothetical protein [uncultured Flavobacterium sp.]|uniref:hypothetical protein n=1 Tax=uncultured Flavobacterium sp. TaxID=165435 RepID=UPI0025E82028|nr:hypothetical protein [uncultured Flavobacterium sp.]
MTSTTVSPVSGNVTIASKGDNDVWIVKMTNTGVISWQQRYGGDKWDLSGPIIQLADNSYITLCSSQSSQNSNVTGINNGRQDIWRLKLNANGGLTWQRLIGGAGGDGPQSISVAPGGYIISAYSSSNATGDVWDTSNGNSDYWVVKVDINGNILMVPDVGQ